MKAAFAVLSLFVAALPVSSFAEETSHPMSQHPAVLVKRQQANAQYDYTAQFYPHPAWLYLETDRHEMGDHPAVIVARRAAEAKAATAQAEAASAALRLAAKPSVQQ